MNFFRVFCLFSCLTFSATILVSAQEVLTLEEAIQIGLENNYSIRIAKNSETIATNSNTKGNAGFLPSVSTSGNVGYTSNNTTQKFFSGDERTGKGAGNTAIRFGVAVNWTAFDGFRMYAVKDRLDLVEQKSKSFTRRQMHELVTQIQNRYYGLVRVLQRVEIIQQSIQLNNALKELAEAKLKIGTGTSLEVLQTANRLSADSSALLNLSDLSVQAQIELNRLMNRDPEISFSVPIEIPDIILPPLSELNELVINQNHELKLLRYDEQIAITQIKEAKSSLYPTLDLNAGYNYNFSKAEVGFLLSNRSFGPTIGVTANYDIFQGRNLKKDIQNAELFQQNTILTRENLEADLLADLAFFYKDYMALRDLLDLEKRNLETAEKNTLLARELYRSGRATNFDVREAILAETQVKDRLSDVVYRQKINEIMIKNLAGIPLYNLN